MARIYLVAALMLVVLALAVRAGAADGGGGVEERLEAHARSRRLVQELSKVDGMVGRQAGQPAGLAAGETHTVLAASLPVVSSTAAPLAPQATREQRQQWLAASLLSCAEQAMETLAGGEEQDWHLRYDHRHSGIPLVRVLGGSEAAGGSEEHLLAVAKFYVYPQASDALFADLLSLEKVTASGIPQTYRTQDLLQHSRCLVHSASSTRFFDMALLRAVPGRTLTSLLVEYKTELRHISEVEETSGRLLSRATVDLLIAEHVRRAEELRDGLIASIGAVARAMAELHLVTSLPGGKVQLEALPHGSSVRECLSAYMQVFPDMPDGVKEAILVEAETRLELAAGEMETETPSYYHGDLTPDNVVYDSETKMVGLLDLLLMSTSFRWDEDESKRLASTYAAMPVAGSTHRAVGHGAWDYFFFIYTCIALLADVPGADGALQVESVVQAFYCAARELPLTCVDDNLLWANRVTNYYQWAALAAVSPHLLVQ